MKQLVALTSPPTHIARYEGIRDRKKHVVRNVLIANAVTIASRFTELEAAIAAGTLNLIGLSPLIDISSELRSCYDSETKRLVDLKEAIRKAQPAGQLKYCPMCGTTINHPFDHYLPAVRFPEFSVHPLNVIPCCSKCNSIKDAFWLCPAGQRLFIHGYADAIPTAAFLSVELVTRPPLTAVGARFDLSQAGMNLNDWTLIKNHFDRLGLISRFNDLGNDEISEMLRSAKAFLQNGGADVEQFLSSQAENFSTVHGANHWRAVLLKALSLHPLLREWIEAA